MQAAKTLNTLKTPLCNLNPTSERAYPLGEKQPPLYPALQRLRLNHNRRQPICWYLLRDLPKALCLPSSSKGRPFCPHRPDHHTALGHISTHLFTQREVQLATSVTRDYGTEGNKKFWPAEETVDLSYQSRKCTHSHCFLTLPRQLPDSKFKFKTLTHDLDRPLNDNCATRADSLSCRQLTGSACFLHNNWHRSWPTKMRWT